MSHYFSPPSEGRSVLQKVREDTEAWNEKVVLQKVLREKQLHSKKLAAAESVVEKEKAGCVHSFIYLMRSGSVILLFHGSFFFFFL